MSAALGRSQASSHRSPQGEGKPMTTNLKIDFVSDVSCPWCAIGLSALEQALAAVEGDIHAEMHFHPFELNPQMGPDGQDVTEHLTQKYGSTPEQQAQVRATIRERGAEAGFAFKPEGRGRIWNTFDAHRLLHWAGNEGRQSALKHALLGAYFTDGKPVPGKDAYRHEWMGAKWKFANQAHLDLFKADPAKYAPQFGGYCAYGVASGYLVKIEPDQWSIVDGKLYLNYDAGVSAKWQQDRAGFIRKADATFGTLLAK